MEFRGNPGLPAIVVAALGMVALIRLGALATDLGPWYYALKQPPWKPSDLWFGPVWTTIFTLSACVGLLARAGAPEGAPRYALAAAFVFNAVLNLLWSGLFFRLPRLDWALIEVVPLWASILLLIGLCARYDAWSRWLLSPFLIWVAFAAYLNLAVARLNGPF